MAKRRRQRPLTQKLEEDYAKLMQNPPALLPATHPENLEQPSPYRLVPTVTTYGAYEDPV